MDRKLTVHASSGCYQRGTPILQLKGSYLTDYGFQIGEQVTVHLEDRRIVIIPTTKEIKTVTK